MKRFLKIASLLLLAGGVVLYTGCTKDVQEDVSGLTKRVTSLEDSYSQLDAAKASVANLEAVKESLLEQIEALKKANEDLAADVKADKAQIEAQIKANEEKIALLQTDVNKLQSEIGGFKTRISTVEARLQTIQDKLNELAESATVEAVNARVKALETQIESINTEIDAINKDIADIKGQVKGLASRVTSIVVCPSQHSEIAAFRLGYEESELILATFEFKPGVPSDISSENIAITVGAGRSRSDYSTKVASEEDYITVTGEDIIRIDTTGGNGCRVRILGRVYTKEKSIERKNIGQRTEWKNTDKLCQYFSISYTGTDDAGDYTVSSEYVQAVANYNNGGEDLNDIARFVSEVTPNMKEKYLSQIELSPFSCDYMQAADTTDNPFAGYKVVFPLDLMRYKHFFSDYENEEELDIDYLNGILGTDVDVKYGINIQSNPPIYTEDTEKDTLLNKTFGFKPGSQESLKDYVGDDYYAETYLILGGYDTREDNAILIYRPYSITKVQHVFKPLNLNLYWNYKNYETAKRFAVVDKNVINDLRPATTALYWDQICGQATTIDTEVAGVTYYFQDGAVLPMTGALAKVNADSVGVFGTDTLDLSGFQGTYKHSRSNDTDQYILPVNLSIDEVPDFSIGFEQVTIPGSVTKSKYVTYHRFAAALAERDELKSGLTDVDQALLADVKSRIVYAIEQYNTPASPAYADSISVCFTGKAALANPHDAFNLTYSETGDSLTVEILATDYTKSIVNYDNDLELVVTIENPCMYGTTYKATIPFKTSAPNFTFVTKEFIKNGVGTANGSREHKGSPLDGTYLIDSMWFNKQVAVLDIAKANEQKDPNIVYEVWFQTSADGLIYNPSYMTKAPVLVDQSEGNLYNIMPDLSTAACLNWHNYKSLSFKVFATLRIRWQSGDGSFTNTDPVQVGYLDYTIQTIDPIKYEKHYDITKQRIGSESVVIKLYEGAVVYGAQNGSIDSIHNIFGGASADDWKYDYGAGFTYSKPSSWNVTVNGEKPKSWVLGTDYMYDTSSQTLTIMGDNLDGDILIEVDSWIEYSLDGSTSSGDKHQPINIKITK